MSTEDKDYQDNFRQSLKALLESYPGITDAIAIRILQNIVDEMNKGDVTQ
jgi:hypothetical protein